MADGVKQYVKTEGNGIKSQAGSNHALQIKTEYKIDYESDDANTDRPKHWNENELYGEDKLKCEHQVQSGSQELHIKRDFDENEGVDDDETEKLNSSFQFTTTNDNGGNSDTELKRKSFVKVESPDFNVKYEEIYIKTENKATTRYDPVIKRVTRGQCTSVGTVNPIEKESKSQTVPVVPVTFEYLSPCQGTVSAYALQNNRFQDDVLTPTDASEMTTYQCDICTFKAKQDNDLEQHMLTHQDPSDVDAYSCGICTYKARQKGTLKRHMVTHQSTSEVTMHSCGVCTFKTKHKRSLNMHSLIHKNSSEVTMYSCGKCAYKAKIKYKLKEHMLVHKNPSELTTYPCGICSYKTVRKHNLRLHMLIHKDASEVTMYSCQECSYKTKQKFSLNSHILSMHKKASEVTMYSCETCTYRSKRKRGLREHMLIHKNFTEVPVYSCEICNHKTKRKRNLRKHMLTHKKAPVVGTVTFVQPVLYVPPVVVYMN